MQLKLTTRTPQDDHSISVYKMIYLQPISSFAWEIHVNMKDVKMYSKQFIFMNVRLAVPVQICIVM